MDQNSKLPNGISMQEVLRLAASPAGQQLIALMQEKGGTKFAQAIIKGFGKIRHKGLEIS